MLDDVLQDLRGARRLLVAAPGLCLAVVVCLTLGIGVNAGIFDLFNALLLRQPPVKAPQRLVSLWRTERFASSSVLVGMSWRDFLGVRERASTLAGVAATTGPGTVVVRLGDRTMRPAASLVSAGYFDVLGIEPSRGRFLLPEETSIPGEGRAAVISHDFWLENLHGVDPVGSRITVNGVEVTIVGVGPPGFRGRLTDFRADMWVPITLIDALFPPSGANTGGMFGRQSLDWIHPVGRLSEGASIDAAQAEMSALGAVLAEDVADVRRGDDRIFVRSDIRRHPLETRFLRGWATFGMVIAGASLLIACANVASLLLAHSMARRRELAVRLALGCSRVRLSRQLLVEATALAGIAAMATLLVLLWGHALLLQLVPYYESAPVDTTPDLRVVLFVVGISAGIVPFATVGTVPRFTRGGLTAALKDLPGRVGPRRQLRQALVIGQVSVSVAVLVAAALLSRSLWKVWAADPGFRTGGLVMATLDALQLSGIDEPEAEAIYPELIDGLEETPGIMSAVLTDVPPGAAANEVSVSPVAADAGDAGAPPAPKAMLHFTGSGFFRTAGIPLMLGRDLDDSLDAGAPAEIVVNETLARQLGLGSTDLGRELVVGRQQYFDGGPWRAVVVGIAGDTVNIRPGLRPRPTLWASWFTHPGALTTGPKTMLVRVASEADKGVVAGIRGRLETLAPEVPVTEIRTGSQWMAVFAATERKSVWFAGAFAILALALAMLGAYATIRQAVQEQQRDLGVRLALGATRAHIAGVVIRYGMRLAGWGIVIGTGLALAGGRYLASQLHGISAHDPVSVLLAIAITLAVVTGATLLPARTAAGTDPVAVIRES